jgi:hypothetical protein
MPIRQVPGTDRKYLLIAYDKNGVERRDDPDGVMTERATMALASGGTTDVFLVSHGWKGDVPAAIDQYDRWIGAMTRASDDLARVRAKTPDYAPIIIGLHWPSQPWGDEEVKTGGLSFDATNLAAGGEWDAATKAPSDEELIERYADRIADTPAAKSAIETIIRSARTMAAQGGAPAKLPQNMIDAYRTLDLESGMASGMASAPGDDRKAFDPQRAYAAVRPAVPGAFGFPGWDTLLGPLRQLSFWKMKERGRHFGETGAHQLLSSLQDAAGKSVRFHVAGHSFGCVVVSGMLGGPKGSGATKTPVHSATLIQGALSLWSYAPSVAYANGAPGYFSPILTGKRVAGPLVTTQSRYDRAVGFWYPKAAGVSGQVTFDVGLGELPEYGGVGTFGLQGVSDATGMEMLPVAGSYGFAPRKIYNLNSDRFIKDGNAMSGAHSDIAHPEVAHAVWEAVLTDAPAR